MSDDLHSRMGRVETHVEYLRGDVDRLHSKVDQLLARPSAGAQAVAFVTTHWKTLLMVALTLFGAGWAAPIMAALK